MAAASVEPTSGVQSDEEIEYEEIEEEIEVEEVEEGDEEEEGNDDGDDMDLGEDPIPINHILKHKGNVNGLHHGVNGEIDSRTLGAISDIGGSSKEAMDELRIEEKTYHVAREDSRIRPRCSTPELEFNNDSSKRPAVLCEFFAKGWCIKGNSCKFLHIKDQIGIGSQAEQEISDTAQKKGEFQVLEMSSSIQHRQKSRLESLLPLPQCDRLEPSLRYSRRDLIMKDHQGNSVLMTKDGHCRAALSNCSSMLSENCENTRNGSHATCLEDNNQNLPVSVSSLHRSRLSFSCPLNGDQTSIQKQLDNDLEHHASRSASVRRSSSPHSGHEYENLSQTNPLVDKQSSVRSITNIPYNWEPSVPFRPLYPLTKRLLSNISSRNLYDHVHDSIGGINSGEEASALRFHKEGNTDAFATGTLGTECSSNNYSILGKDVGRKDDGRTLGVERKDKKSLLKEKKLLGCDHVRDSMEDKNSADCDSKMESGGQSQYRSQGKEERSRQMIEADADLKVEESRALKNFHATLVEVVKEMLRPKWHGGLLSKDAHKIIVKKSVEKVLSTIPPHQVPNTPELVKLYMSASQEKLTKLVEGYVDKYRKS